MSRRRCSSDPREITADDIEALAVGAWILGTGGGGSPYLGLLNMRRLYAEGIGLLMPRRSSSPTTIGSRSSRIWARRWSARSG